jgi:transcriptional regulator with GAF, ATPase, and Fis domain
MKQLRMTLWSNIFSNDLPIYYRALRDRMEDFSTLLLGETGSGKGAAAAAMGRAGPIPFDKKTGRFSESFTTVFVMANLSQFSESLIESELFGHSKGAFTGAIDRYEGLFAQCSARGTLLLDEIGELSPAVQIKLLRVLQDRTFTPVGSHTRERFAGRVIGATNQPLDKLRSEGRFRDDFYYRLCSDVITIPPLRQRIAESPAELPQMVARLVNRITGGENNKIVNIVVDTLAADLPSDYSWPGNVRELEQAVRRIVLTGHYHGDMTKLTSTLEEDVAKQIREGKLDLKQLSVRYCQILYQRLGTYDSVAKSTGLDRRTVKKYLDTATDKRSVH